MINKLLITAILLVLSANLYSQQTDRLITVRKLAVKHDKIDEFIALQREMSWHTTKLRRADDGFGDECTAKRTHST